MTICTLPIRENPFSDIAFLLTVEISVEAYWDMRLFGSQLKGYFRTSITKIFTGHLLSVHPEDTYSSLSTPFCLCSFYFFLL